jgi:hypothetical protein
MLSEQYKQNAPLFESKTERKKESERERERERTVKYKKKEKICMDGRLIMTRSKNKKSKFRD